MKIRRKVVLLGVKALVTICLVAWLSTKANWPQLVELLQAVDWAWLSLAALLQLVAFALFAVRWWIVLRHLLPEVRFLETLPAVYMGLFANNFMPAGTGSDLAKVFGMRSATRSAKNLVAAVFIERVVGLSTVLSIGSIALWAWSPERFGIAEVTLIGLVLFAGLLLATLFTPLSRWIAATIRHFGGHTWLDHLADTLDNVYRFSAAWVEVGLAFLLTLMLQSLVVASYIALGKALGSSMDPLAYFVAIPLVFLAVSLPISFGGLGVREGTFVAIMVLAGMAEQIAIGVSVLFLFQLLVLTCPGGILLLQGRHVPRSRAA
ncbi:MAG: lysylphosphatidylglycerol synthase transmembrane domain-containing protein [Xanthomonadales bacterium]|nr:lysylphosphatidylglycerol synthase transmembrane domain-containing protein [Xanthomonadales bacterium]